jgi:hypothetical protein
VLSDQHFAIIKANGNHSYNYTILFSMFQVSCINQMYKIFEKTKKYTWMCEFFRNIC